MQIGSHAPGRAAGFSLLHRSCPSSARSSSILSLNTLHPSVTIDDVPIWSQSRYHSSTRSDNVQQIGLNFPDIRHTSRISPRGPRRLFSTCHTSNVLTLDSSTIQTFQSRSQTRGRSISSLSTQHGEQERSAIQTNPDQYGGIVHTTIKETTNGEPLAGIKKEDDGSISLKLYQSVGTSQGADSALEDLYNTSPISIPTPRETQRIKNEASRKEGFHFAIRRKEHDSFKDYISWESLLVKITTQTPTVRGEFKSIRIHGKLEVIHRLYHNILNQQTHRVFIEAFTTGLDAGFVRLVSTEAEIHKIQTDLSKKYADVIFGEIHNLEEMKEKITYLSDAEKETSDYFTPRTLTHAPGLVGKPKAAYSAEEIQMPSDWTYINLLDYIEALINSREPSSGFRVRTNKVSAAQKLMDICFSSKPDIRRAVSWAALHRTLQFLLEQRMLPMSRTFMQKMINVGFPPSIETYNLQLRHCAAEQNLRAFSQWLDIMAKQNIVPNDQTWLAFMSALPAAGVKQTVARAMQRKGLDISPNVAHADYVAIIDYGFTSFLNKGGTAKQYVQAMDVVFGPNWLNESAASRLSKELSQKGSVLDVVTILDTMSQRVRRKPEKDAIHALLAQCVKTRNTHFAVWLSIYASRAWNQSSLDHISLELMFKVALKSRMYNVARVVWQFAAAKGELKFWMRSKVTSSLWMRYESDDPNVKGHWLSSFGVTIRGEDCLHSSNITPDEVIAGDRDFYLIVKHPLPSFGKLLVRALAMDDTWRDKGLLSSTDAVWKIANAIEIPFSLVRRVDSQQRTRRSNPSKRKTLFNVKGIRKLQH